VHIPAKPDTERQLPSFFELLEAAKEPNPDYDSSAWLYVPITYAEYRYILGTKGERPLIAIGINPSTAAPNALDNTLKSVERIAHANGYDSFIMFNVYAERATDPDHMEREFNLRLHEENMKAFEYVLRLSKDTPAIWAAWGTLIKKRDYLRRCVSDMITLGEQYGAGWFTCGARSKNGAHPHHPLYLRSDSPLDRFDVREYLQGFAE